MSLGIRKTLYLSPKKDKDILKFIEPLLDHYDFSQIIRDLVRDGILFRSGTVQKEVRKIKVLQSNTPKLEGIKLEKKETTTEELEDRLDDF